MQLSKIIWQFVEFLLNDSTKFTINYPKKKGYFTICTRKKIYLKKKRLIDCYRCLLLNQIPVVCTQQMEYKKDEYNMLVYFSCLGYVILILKKTLFFLFFYTFVIYELFHTINKGFDRVGSLDIWVQ